MPSFRLKTAQSPEYGKWAADFESSRAGKLALQALGEFNRPTDNVLQKCFKDEVLLACYQAVSFALHGDVNSEKRDLLRDISNFDDPLTDHIDSLLGDIIFLQPIHDILVREGKQDVEGGVGNSKFTFSQLLAHLELLKMGIRRFQDDVETHSERDECWVDGNMLYPVRIDRGKQYNKANPSTCLMFQLATYFRLWSHPNGQQLFNNKNKLDLTTLSLGLPTKGRRNDKLIALFVEASFNNRNISEKSKATETTVRARLEKIDKTVRLKLWDDSSFDIIKLPHLVIKRMDSEFKARKPTQKI